MNKFSLEWTNVGRKYIEDVKGDLHQFFVLDFNDQVMNRFVGHQMLNTFKEFWGRLSQILQKEQLRTNKAARQKQPYNHSSGSKSFLQQQHELVEQRGESIDRVELFWQTHVRDGTNEICEMVLGRRPDYSKGLGWRSKPKAYKTTSASNSTTTCPQSTVELQLQAKLDQAMQRIEEQTRNHKALVLEVE
ncbi:CACTA en-spm transposon protein [Cucumis melo var. makuwa]|uniref:CACTA en-spm transposon protein n=1 Tax=Cucumis melo var. makuwa TaxID=1194695 RepID=A0A5A7UN96_CUCMM|nr:CACTA en-spm transposon protein [Cucumis melo var. makuwa]